MLREELGSDAHRVRFLDMENVGRNPARIIPAWQAWVDEHAPAGRGFRGIGEPIWAGRSPAELLECQQHEQLLNTAFDDGPGWSLLCPYDTTSLPDEVIARAHDTHPGVVVGDGRLDSASYPHPDMSHSAMFGDPLPEPAGPVRQLAFDRRRPRRAPGPGRRLRGGCRATAQRRRTDLDRQRTGDQQPLARRGPRHAAAVAGGREAGLRGPG